MANETYIEFTQALYTTSESEQFYYNLATITLTRTGNLNNYADVEIWLNGGSASEGSDYYPFGFPQYVSFYPGEDTKTIEFEIVDDGDIEGTETIELQLQTAPGNFETVIGNQDTASLEILDNEVANVSFSQATYTVNENDLTYPNQAIITLTRTGNLNNYSDVEVWLTGGSAIEDLDYQSFGFPQYVTFYPGETTQTIEFEIWDDGEIEGTENINLQLQTDPGNFETFIGNQDTASLEIIDDEVSYIGFAQTIYKAHENEQALITLTRTGNLDHYADVEVWLNGGSAQQGFDYDHPFGGPQLVTFQPGQDTQTMVFDILDDGDFEGTETVNLQLQTFPGSFDTFLGSNNTASLEILDDEVANVSFMTIGEVGQVSNFNHISQTIQLDRSYVNPVVFVSPLSRNGSDPAIVRITDIQDDSFTAYLQEPEYRDGPHVKETFNYLVLEAGTWQLADGTILEIGTLDTNSTTSSEWEAVDFQNDFQDTPVILSQVQTNSDHQFVRTRQKQANSNGFKLSLEEEEALKPSGHNTETVGWLAIESGTGTWDGFEYQASHTEDEVTHQWHDLNLEENFSDTPYLFASLASYDGGDSAGLRYRNFNNSQLEIMIEEDKSLDSEILHTREIVDFFAISDFGELTATAYEPF